MVINVFTAVAYYTWVEGELFGCSHPRTCSRTPEPIKSEGSSFQSFVDLEVSNLSMAGGSIVTQ